jgi:hypothetical protein
MTMPRQLEEIHGEVSLIWLYALIALQATLQSMLCFVGPLVHQARIISRQLNRNLILRSTLVFYPYFGMHLTLQKKFGSCAENLE